MVVLKIVLRSFIAIVLFCVVIISFAYGIIGLNEMCGSDPGTCPWNPPQKLLAAFIVGGVLCLSTIVLTIIGLSQCFDERGDRTDTLGYSGDIYCAHAGFFTIAIGLVTLSIVLMTIIYSAMPRPFDRDTLIYFLVATHFIGGLSISWAFIPVNYESTGWYQDWRQRARVIDDQKRNIERINAETRKAEAEARRLELQLQLKNQQHSNNMVIDV